MAKVTTRAPFKVNCYRRFELIFRRNKTRQIKTEKKQNDSSKYTHERRYHHLNDAGELERFCYRYVTASC